jgi:hypothetical protein
MGRRLPRAQARAASDHRAGLVRGAGGISGKIGQGDAQRSRGCGCWGFALAAQVHDPIVRADLRRCQKAKAVIGFWRGVEAKAAKAVGGEVKADQLSQRRRRQSQNTR